MEIAIVDDEKIIINTLEEKVKKIFPELKIKTYLSGIDLIKENKIPEIILLDIEMPDKNGMEIARCLRKSGNISIIIFVTALEEYVFQAFDVRAFHYLVKPFSDEKFKEVVSCAILEYKKNTDDLRKKQEKSIVIKCGGEYKKVLLDTIMYAEVFNRKVTLHKKDESIEYYGKMTELEKQLGEDFFRTHRSYLVNFKFVDEYNSSEICIKKEKIPMSKKNYPLFVKKYMKYNQRTGRG